VGVVTVVFTLLSGITWVRDEFFQATWRLGSILPHWPWWVWSLGGSLILVAVVLESATRVVRKHHIALAYVENPAVAMRRRQLYVELGKLNAVHLPILHYVVRCGDRSSYQVQLYFQEHGFQRDIGQIEQALAEITRLTGFLDFTGYLLESTGTHGAYVVSSSWKPQLEEWAANTEDFLPRPARGA
jgi:hypothetical protein